MDAARHRPTHQRGRVARLVGAAMGAILAAGCASVTAQATSTPGSTSAAQAIRSASRAGNPNFRIERLSGADRYAAAAAISKRFHPSGAGVVAIASGEAYADGIAAGTFAAEGGLPVLFVKRDHIPAATAAELDRLQPSMVFVFGGPSTISDDIVRELGTTWADDGAVERIGGADRFEVAARASARAFTGPLRTVYVASGRVWPDGLTGGAAAAVDGAPMLLTDTSQLPATTEAELRRLSPGRILLLGGTTSVSTSVADALGRIAPVERVWGPDRYATALAISKRVFGSDRPGLMVATGANYPDALAGSAAAVVTRGPILLSRTHSLPPGTEGELTRLGPGTAYLLGGTASVPIEIPRLVQKELGICWAGAAPTDGRTEVITAVSGVSGQKIANTFDMGGRMTGAADIVRYLIDHQVCTTFFPTSIMADTPEGHDVLALISAHPELFEVGNHTVHHCDLVRGGGGSPTAAPCQVAMTDGFVSAELSDAETVLRRLSGMPVRPYWRPPFGSYDARVQSLVASVGYPKTVMWSRDTADWDPNTSTAEILDAVLNPTPPAGTIVLNHLGGFNTGAALPTIVDTLRARGVVFTTVSDLIDD